VTREDHEQRLERLESQSTFQEHLLTSLDAIVAAQAARIAAFERELASLRAGLTALRDQGDSTPGDEPPPPHY